MINVTLSNNNGSLVVIRISLITHNVLVCPISLVGGPTLAGNGWACRTRAIKNLRLLQRDKINETQ
jgi:hypothetical protein